MRMNSLQEQIFVLSTPLYVIIIGAEMLASHLHGVKAYSLKDTVHNFCLSLLTGASDLVMRGVSLVILTSFFNSVCSISHAQRCTGSVFCCWLISCTTGCIA